MLLASAQVGTIFSASATSFGVSAGSLTVKPPALRLNVTVPPLPRSSIFPISLGNALDPVAQWFQDHLSILRPVHHEGINRVALEGVADVLRCYAA
jgi:hypothetical protein